MALYTLNKAGRGIRSNIWMIIPRGLHGRIGRWVNSIHTFYIIFIAAFTTALEWLRVMNENTNITRSSTQASTIIAIGNFFLSCSWDAK